MIESRIAVPTCELGPGAFALLGAPGPLGVERNEVLGERDKPVARETYFAPVVEGVAAADSVSPNTNVDLLPGAGIGSRLAARPTRGSRLSLPPILSLCHGAAGWSAVMTDTT